MASVLLFFGAIDGIGLLDAFQLAIGRNHHDVEVVDLRELFGLGIRRAGHAGQLRVLAEVVLERDRRQRLVLALDLDLGMGGVVLLGLDRLMEPVTPPPSGHQPAGELVDDHHPAVLHHVLDVDREQRVGAQCLIDVVEERHVLRIVETRAAGTSRCRAASLGLGHPAFRQVHRLVLFVDDVVARLLQFLALLGLDITPGDRPFQARNNPIDLVIEIGRFLGRA